MRAAALGTSSTTPYGLGNQAGDLRGVAVDSSGTATGESESWGTANRLPDVWRPHQITDSPWALVFGSSPSLVSSFLGSWSL